MDAKFILSKKKVLEQYNKLSEIGLKVSYSYKTNKEVGSVLENTDSDFSIHDIDEINSITNKEKIWFFPQAWNKGSVKIVIDCGVKNFVLDNEGDLDVLMDCVRDKKIKISILLRMKLNEHRIGSSKYYVYGMDSKKVCRIIDGLSNEEFVDKIGIHIHRKTQNTSEWNLMRDLKDSIENVLDKISILNIGGGLPVEYKTYTSDVMPYIIDKISELKKWLDENKIDVYVEPGRFIAGPAVKLETEIIQIDENKIVINTSIYNCALDSMVTGIRMMVENELDKESDKGESYLIKGNTPTRDDIFRYNVKLDNPKVGDKIVFLNAGAYNYTTDFCNLKKLKTEVVE